MFRKVLALCAMGVAGFAAATSLTSSPSGAAPARAQTGAWFNLSGRVTRVVDGDTLIVRIAKGSERVRILGIDTPEAGACYGAQATRGTKALALGKGARLVGDRTQARRDRYGRLLAYVTLPTGRDLGLQLLSDGFARVLVVGRPFSRFKRYSDAEAHAKSLNAGMWSACSAAPPATSSTSTTSSTASTTNTTVSTTTTTQRCHPSYPDVCIPPPPPDLDCKDIPYRKFRVIYTVPDPDPHRFDGDRDGIGCES